MKILLKICILYCLLLNSVLFYLFVSNYYFKKQKCCIPINDFYFILLCYYYYFLSLFYQLTDKMVFHLVQRWGQIFFGEGLRSNQILKHVEHTKTAPLRRTGGSKKMFLFNDTLNTFYLWTYGIRCVAKDQR